MQDNERIIELIAKSLDEPLDPREQQEVNAAMNESLAIRLAADGLHEFDALLKRTGMAIPDEGFPLRFLQRLEAYEKSRTRLQWYLTLGLIFLGLVAGLGWLALNWNGIFDAFVFIATNTLVLFPLFLTFFLVLLRMMGQGPLLVYASLALLLTLVLARASGSWQPAADPTTR